VKDSGTAARQLTDLLNAKTTVDRSAEDRQSLEERLTRVTQNCKLCHQKFRDNPSGQK
jgi:cytochrome c556